MTLKEAKKQLGEAEKRAGAARLQAITNRSTLREWDRVRGGRKDLACPFFKGCLSLRGKELDGPAWDAYLREVEDHAAPGIRDLRRYVQKGGKL